ncbi:MAG: glycosyltransferase family 2 protein [Paludibacteraceae bacterium]|nr:glycosyltransferase family 2 protein [Paludibacteraceae bacterium]
MAYSAMIPRFSIIVPLYNKAPYVRKALDSVISQTCTDWECIIVDDGSTDNSMNVVRERISESGSERVRVIQQQNVGVAAARNRGVRESKGEYICFLDADDWWEPTFLEEIDKLIAEYPDAGIYATNYIYYKPGKTHVALSLPRGYMNYPEAYLQCGSMPVTSITTCMPRKIFDEMGGFPVGIKLGEDFLLWAKTVLHNNVAYCEKALAYYNNDVPAFLRATRNLHKPEHSMLFHLNEIESIVDSRLSIDERGEWKALLDKLRVSGLMDYWLSNEYHDIAASEIAKIDWSRQPRSVKAQYEKPVWFLKAKRRFMQIGSYWKQKLILYLWK